MTNPKMTLTWELDTRESDELSRAITTFVRFDLSVSVLDRAVVESDINDSDSCHLTLFSKGGLSIDDLVKLRDAFEPPFGPIVEAHASGLMVIRMLSVPQSNLPFTTRLKFLE